MTNLVEKLLSTGFGLLILISFLTIINPFLSSFTNYSEFEEKYEKINENINLIDSSIRYSIKYKTDYSQEILIFYNINITVEGIQVNYEFYIFERDFVKYSYDLLLESGFYALASQNYYNLNILYLSDSISIKFKQIS
ncbi:MAG: hypothetical protein GF311_13125 [Candidatus Lokiarchaeota archaeon]|nr:hypothetical protein [Candidatus Lokiarchaeota archaeon]